MEVYRLVLLVLSGGVAAIGGLLGIVMVLAESNSYSEFGYHDVFSRLLAALCFVISLGLLFAGLFPLGR